MGKIQRAILLVLFLSVSTSALWGEDADPSPTPSMSPGDSQGYAEMETAARNFTAWWNDQSGYLLLPHIPRYSGRSPEIGEIAKLLIMVGYRGELAEVVRAQAISELREMGLQALKPLYEVLRGKSVLGGVKIPAGMKMSDMRAFAAMALGEMEKQEALPELGLCLDDEDPFLRAACATAIGKLGGIQFTDRLIEDYTRGPRNTNPYLRSAYLGGIAFLAAPRAMPELFATLDDRDARVRGNLALAFGMLSEEAGPRIIKHYLHEYGQYPSVRLACVWALAEMGRRQAATYPRERYTGELLDIEDTIRYSVYHENVPLLRIHFAWALGHLGTDTSFQILRSMIGDATPEVQAAVLVGLALSGRLKSVPPEDIRAIPAVSNLYDVLNSAMLIDPRDGKIIEFENLLNSFTSGLSQPVKPSGEPESEILPSVSDIGSSALILLAAKTFISGRFSFIEGGIPSSNSFLVRQAALLAMGMLQGGSEMRRASISLARITADLPNSPVLYALGNIAIGMLYNDQSVPYLKSRLSGEKGHPESPVSVAVAITLLRGLPYRDPLLAVLEKDKSSAVRSAAAFALGLIRAPGVLEALVDIISRDTNSVDLRVSGCFALALLSDPAGVPALYKLVTDRKLARSADGNYLRGCAALAMSRLGAGRAYMLALKKEIESSDDSNFTAFASISLGLAGKDEYLDTVIPLLNSPLASVRQAACLALGFSRNKAYWQELSAIISDNSKTETRAYAAVAAGLLNDDAAAFGLADILDSHKENSAANRAAIVQGLALSGVNNARVMQTLIMMGGDSDARCRKYSAVARFVLGDPEGIDLFLKIIYSSGMDHTKLDGQLIREWANESLPQFFKLRSYLLY
ncbi:MAG: HEAT repeat domain-containing protein [Candidatus Brocadiia bacterium]